MILDIPTSQTLAYYQQVTPLDGVDYVLRFQWNSREQSWYIAIADVDDVPIVGFVKLVPQWRILRRIVDQRRPPGELVLIDTSGKGAKPGFAELGTRCILTYYEKATVDAIAAGA